MRYAQPSSPYGLVIRVDPEVSACIEALRQPGESVNDVLRRVLGLPPKVKGGKVAELKFAKAPLAPGEPTVDKSTGATIYPHATKEQLIERAHTFLAGGCCVTFPGIPREEFIELLKSAHDAIANQAQPVTGEYEHLCDARFGIERILRSMGAWVE